MSSTNLNDKREDESKEKEIDDATNEPSWFVKLITNKPIITFGK